MQRSSAGFMGAVRLGVRLVVVQVQVQAQRMQEKDTKASKK